MLVREDEHRDASRLSVAKRSEDDRPVERANGLPQCLRDRPELRLRTVSEKRQREVEVGALDQASMAAEGVMLPRAEHVTHVGWEREGAEETQAFTVSHGSGTTHS